jgi:hypothetical protein
VELRVLATAANSPQAWDLRCELREKLIAYIQQEFPDALPRYRGEIASAQMQDQTKSDPRAIQKPS